MPRPPTETYDRIRLRLDDMIATALRADSAAIAATLKSADETAAAVPAIEFMGQARQLVLAAAVALSAALEAHQHVPGPHQTEICPSCGTTGTCPTVRRVADTLAAYLPGPVALGRADAWRRAAEALAARERGLLVGVEATPLAYVAWVVAAAYPGDSAEAGGVLLIDRHSGRLTRWPALPVADLGERYRRYVNGEPFR